LILSTLTDWAVQSVTKSLQESIVAKRLLLLLSVSVVVILGVYFFARGFPGATDPVPTATAPPPPEVGVIVAQSAEVPLPSEYAGRVVGLRDVEVRSQVGGLLLEREYEDGGKVEKDQVLFRIDPATYRVALSRAEAQLQQAQATLRLAEENFARVEELHGRGVSTDKQRDEAQATRDQARASVRLAQAEIESAKLNLDYTVLNAPVSGVTALQSPSIGTLILPQQTLLTTITPLDPAYVSFSFTDEEGRAFRVLNERRAKPITGEDLTVDLQFGDGSVYSQTGKIDTAAQRVDPQTGTIQARVMFPNPEGVLLPGQFVRVRIRGVTLPDAIVIPKQAVSQGPQGPFVYVIRKDTKAEVRPIRLAQELAGGWVVEEGLSDGDRVVVEGVIRVRPGAAVRPVASGSQPADSPIPASTDPAAGADK
jgi:membrane fusion protein (multidrug efflux system)